ncbi:hypothetical protein QYY85_21065, partial [Xanthomonas campestris pv. campestris]|uniref:hypothetical protein n=1 Tax=Xanthomonas campestris TaxID=339 RepID=UPI002AD46562
LIDSLPDGYNQLVGRRFKNSVDLSGMGVTATASSRASALLRDVYRHHGWQSQSRVQRLR